MKQRTLDILDSSLRDGQKEFTDLPDHYRFATSTRKNPRIDPKLSEEAFLDYDSTKFKWSTPVKFADKPDFNSIIIDNKIGIYLMYVQPLNTILEMPRYLMYVGISGEKGSARPLKERLQDYLNIGQLKKRTSVHQFIQMYYENVYIVYSLYDGDYKELEEVEQTLHEFFYPLYADREFKPRTKQNRKSWS
jgi:hypothetical protein